MEEGDKLHKSMSVRHHESQKLLFEKEVYDVLYAK